MLSSQRSRAAAVQNSPQAGWAAHVAKSAETASIQQRATGHLAPAPPGPTSSNRARQAQPVDAPRTRRDAALCKAAAARKTLQASQPAAQ